MRNYIYFEATLVLVHISTNVLHRELDWIAHFLVKLHLFELILWKHILRCAENALVTQQFLALLLSDDLLRRLLRCVEAQRSWIESERVKELSAPVFGIHVQFEALYALLLLLLLALESLLLAWVTFLSLVIQALLLLFDQIVHFNSLRGFLFQVGLSLFHVLRHLGLSLRECSVGGRTFGDNSCLARGWTHELVELLCNLLVTLLIRDLPDVLLRVLRLSQQSLVPLLLLDNILSVILISLLRFGAIWVDLDCVGQPARVVPARLQVAVGQRTLLQQFRLVSHCRINAHVLQIPCRIFVLN